MPRPDSKSFRDVLTALYRRRGVMWLMLIISLTALYGVTSFWPYSYEANTRLLVKLGRENVNISAITRQTSHQQVVSTGVRQQDVTAEADILTSRFVAESVVERLGVETFFPPVIPAKTIWGQFKQTAISGIKDIIGGVKEVLYLFNLSKPLTENEQAVQKLQKSLDVETSFNSDVIDISLLWKERETAKKILSTMLDIYMEAHTKVHNAFYGDQFFSNQITHFENRVNESERALYEYKLKNKVFAYPLLTKELSRKIVDIQSQLRKAEVDIAEVRNAIAGIKSRVKHHRKKTDVEAPINLNVVIAKYQQRLLDLKLEKRKREIKYDKKSEVISSLEKEISTVKKDMRTEDTAQTQRKIDIFQEDLDILLTRKVLLEKQLQKYQSELGVITGNAVEVRKMERDLKIGEENLALYRKEFEAARIDKVLDKERISNVRIVHPVVVSEKPVKPRKVLIIIIGSILCLLFSVAVAFSLGWYDGTLNTAEDVAHYLEVKFLGALTESPRS